MNPRGACPTVTTPMQTGDGLLARIIPQTAMSVDTFCALCAAAEKYGNGIMEVTQRGSLQVRGLTKESAPLFANAVASLDIGAEDGPPILTSPLLGLDPSEPFDATEFVVSLRQRLAANPLLKSLGPKVSVLVDGGGALHLDTVAADIRLVAVDSAQFQLGMAGNAGSAVQLGRVLVGEAAERVEKVLVQIAELGPAARARDLAVVKERPDKGHVRAGTPRYSTAHGGTRDCGMTDRGNSRGAASGGAASGGVASDSGGMPNDAGRPPANALAVHLLKTGGMARGVALPFGHSTAEALTRFARAAAAATAPNASSLIRSAPGRALLVIGLTQAGVDQLCKAAEDNGFVVNANDARRQVVACAGAPACASAQLPTRQLAPDVARAARAFLGTSNMVHLSGCSKGCAHPGPAALTIIGPDSVILNGRAGDKVQTTISPAGLLADVTKYCTNLRHA